MCGDLLILPQNKGLDIMFLIIDDHTRYCWVYLMKHRFFNISRFGPPLSFTQASSSLRYIQPFKLLSKHNILLLLNVLGVIWVGKYTSNKFCELLTLDKTIYRTLCIDTLEQNSVAERKHMYIIETARSLLLSTSIPIVFWGEAVLTVIGLINTILSSYISGLFHFEKLYGYAPNYFSFRVFSCTCFVFHSYIERSKFSSRSTICVFLGYSEGKKGYCCFDPIT